MIQLNGSELIITIEGDFNREQINKLYEEIGPYASQSSWKTLIVDLFKAESISSAALQGLEELANSSDEAEKQMMVIGCNELVLERIKLYRLNLRFPVGINKSSKELQEAPEKNTKKS